MFQQKINNVYQVAITQDMPANTSFSTSFGLTSNYRTFKLNSILFDYRYLQVGIPPFLDVELPLSQNTTQSVIFSLGNNTGNPLLPDIAKRFTVPAPVPTTFTNGSLISLYQPNQYFFDNFYISQDVQITLGFFNRDLLLDYRHFVNIAIEIYFV